MGYGSRQPSSDANGWMLLDALQDDVGAKPWTNFNERLNVLLGKQKGTYSVPFRSAGTLMNDCITR